MASSDNSIERLEELCTCGICQFPYHSPVAVIPCLHLACGSCLVQWFQVQPTCHLCRQRVTGTSDSYSTKQTVDLFLQSAPEKRRDPDTLAELDAIYTPGQRINLRATFDDDDDSGIDSEEEHMDDDDDDDDDDFEPFFGPCPSCDPNNTHGYVCPNPIFSAPGERYSRAPNEHIACACGRILPVVGLDSQIKCSACHCRTCTSFFQCPEGQTHEIKDLSEFVPDNNNISNTFPGLFGRNNFELQVLQDYLVSTGTISLHTVMSSGTPFQLRNGNNGPIDWNARVCRLCANSIIKHNLKEWWIREYPLIKAQLPDPIAQRPDCWYGTECRTQQHNRSHAERLSHINRPIPPDARRNTAPRPRNNAQPEPMQLG